MFTDSTLFLQKYIRIFVFWLHTNENFRSAQRHRSKTVTIWLYSRRRREKFFTFGFPRNQISASWQSWETEHIFVGQKVGGLKDTLAPPPTLKIQCFERKIYIAYHWLNLHLITESYVNYLKFCIPLVVWVSIKINLFKVSCFCIGFQSLLNMTSLVY